eukprot:6200330-Amphidinium_carterae.2
MHHAVDKCFAKSIGFTLLVNELREQLLGISFRSPIMHVASYPSDLHHLRPCNVEDSPQPLKS